MQIGSDYGNTWNSGTQDQIFGYFNVNNYPKYWVLQKTNKAFLDFLAIFFGENVRLFYPLHFQKTHISGFFGAPGVSGVPYLSQIFVRKEA